MKQVIINTASECVAILLPVVMAIIMAGINAIAKEAKAKTALFKEKKSQAYLLKAINLLDDITTKTVKSIEQTTAAKLREEVKNGIVSREELCKLAVNAYNDITKQLSSEYRDAIAEGVADFETYLTNLIESKVLELKSSTTKVGIR